MHSRRHATLVATRPEHTRNSTEPLCKSKTGRHSYKTARQNAFVIGCATRPVLIVATGLGFATRRTRPGYDIPERDVTSYLFTYLPLNYK